jgi:hypothetical protein
MGGARLSEKELQKIYNEAVKYIQGKNKHPVPRSELCGALGVKPSRLSASLKYGRNAFALGQLKPKHWIMGGPKGYELPYDDDKKLVAYVMQNVKDVRSRTRTQKPLYDYVVATHPELLAEAFKITKEFAGARLDMNPWEAYNEVLDAWGYDSSYEDMQEDYDEY